MANAQVSGTAERWRLATRADKDAIEGVDVNDRWTAGSVHSMLAETAARVPSRPALSFQLKGGPGDPTETLDWRSLLAFLAYRAIPGVESVTAVSGAV